MPDKPQFDMTELGQAAVQMHEMYRELRKAGFSRSEGLDFLARVVAQSMDQADDDEGDTDSDAS